MSMDALEFVKAYQRMCKTYPTCSKGCPLHAGDGVCMLVTSARDTVDIVEKWAQEHSAKTRQSEFLRMFPSACLDDDGVLHISPCVVDREEYSINTCANIGLTCGKCRREFWSQEVE